MADLNREEKAAYMREYSKRPACAVKIKAYREANKLKRNKQRRDWYERNREKVSLSNQAYRKRSEWKTQEKRYNQKRDPLILREYARRRDAKLRSVKIGKISYKTILQHANGVCALCKQQIQDDELYHFDHIIPISRGGAHSQDNLQLAHAKCNWKKNNRLQEELSESHFN